ncbi:MAG TPA: aldo/keto reductase [Terriglobales bacterium]|jgi:aryl-alcohol dehydrogenase-like predicted oxidoreductase
MQQRPLGNSGLNVSKLCLGGNVFGWTADEAASFRILDHFVDAGLNFIDTADVYSVWVPGHKGGESETIIGNWFKRSGKRDRVIIATKVGYASNLTRENILSAVEVSLQRLQTDHIDLYWAHKDDPNTPMEEALEAFTQLKQQGKVRAIGASNYKGARLREALQTSERTGLARYEALQPEYNLADRKDYEQDLESVAEEAGIGVTPYFSLAKGFLSGKYRSEADLGQSARGGGVKGYLNERGFRILSALDEVARETNSNPARVSLAWLMARPSITAPIASATKIEQLDDLIAATELQLSAEQVARLDAASAY